MLLDAKGVAIRWPDVPWSYSALETFENCGWNYRETKTNARKHNYPYIESDAQKFGKLTHKQLEEFVAYGKPLPMMLQSIGRVLEKMSVGALEIIPERSVALTYDLDPCGTFDPMVSYRGVIDLTIMRPDAAIIIDYKTGKNPEASFDQLEMNAVTLMCERPELEEIHAAFYYTKHGMRRMPKFTRADAARVAQSIIPRLIRLKEARDKDQFVPSPGPLCKWCPVTTCQFHSKFVRM